MVEETKQIGGREDPNGNSDRMLAQQRHGTNNESSGAVGVWCGRGAERRNVQIRLR
jgi:hypothetical protein